MSEPYSGPLPVPTPESLPYWRAARQHRLSIPWCNDCQRPFFYPRPFCPTCFGADLSWRDASGRGRLVTYVIPHRPPRNFPIQEPYVIGIVELEEGVRMMSNIVGIAATPDAISCDMPVEVTFDDVTDEIALPKFRPTAAAKPTRP